VDRPPSGATTLPQGHLLIEPYLYDVITEGFYDSSGRRVTTPHENAYGSLTYMNYGLFNKLTVGLIPTFGYNEPGNGPGTAGVGIGDLTVQAQYRLHLFHEGSWSPTTAVNVQETLPTGKYDQLDRASNGLGAGAYTTTLGLYTQTFFWMPNGHILRTRFNVTQAFSKSVNVQDVSVYGTSPTQSRRSSLSTSFTEKKCYFPATAATTSNKIRGPRRTSSTRIRSSLPCSVFPSSSVAV